MNSLRLAFVALLLLGLSFLVAPDVLSAAIVAKHLVVAMNALTLRLRQHHSWLLLGNEVLFEQKLLIISFILLQDVI